MTCQHSAEALLSTSEHCYKHAVHRVPLVDTLSSVTLSSVTLSVDGVQGSAGKLLFKRVTEIIYLALR